MVVVVVSAEAPLVEMVIRLSFSFEKLVPLSGCYFSSVPMCKVCVKSPPFLSLLSNTTISTIKYYDDSTILLPFFISTIFCCYGFADPTRHIKLSCSHDAISSGHYFAALFNCCNPLLVPILSAILISSVCILDRAGDWTCTQ